MFFRRKKADGFDWHKYVRTTIKIRRDQRRARIEEIGRVAAERVKVAGGLAANGVADAAGSGWRISVDAWRASVAKPAVAFPIALCGGVALLSGLYRWFTIAPDRQALLPLGLGFCMLALLAPLVVTHSPSGLLRLPGKIGGISLPKVPKNSGVVASVAAIALALGWYAWGGALPAVVRGEDERPGAGLARALEGRATVLSGEMIRLQGRLLHLSGIEAPDRQQTCTRASKQLWRCGEAAMAALDRLARAKVFRCVTQGGPDILGRTEASCTVDGRDVAGELVKEGHVFSTATYFGGYAALETAARSAGNGLWSGDAERPGSFRAKQWEAAKAKAPDGCPIKGRINGSQKTYLMPWSQGYAKAVIRASRGDRWFCDEAEARNAGFGIEGSPNVAAQ